MVGINNDQHVCHTLFGIRNVFVGVFEIYNLDFS